MSNRVIVITGGSSGIGKATAEVFARDQQQAVILSRSEKTGKEAEAEITAKGANALSSRPTSELRKSWMRLLPLPSSASDASISFSPTPRSRSTNRVYELIEEDWDMMMAPNLKGTLLCCRAAAVYRMKQRSGNIAICSSGHAFNPYPGHTGYEATKGRQAAFVRAAAIDLVPYGIRVNCMIPGATDSRLICYHFSNHPEDEKRLLDKTPLRRLAAPDEIARGVRFLASEDAGFVTGTSLAVDGGLMAQGEAAA